MIKDVRDLPRPDHIPQWEWDLAIRDLRRSRMWRRLCWLWFFGVIGHSIWTDPWRQGKALEPLTEQEVQRVMLVASVPLMIRGIFRQN